MKKEQFHVAGITCASCANVIERVLKKISGVQEVQVNTVNSQASITYDPHIVSREIMNAALQKHKYILHSLETHHPSAPDSDAHGKHNAHDHGKAPVRAEQEALLADLKPKILFALPAAVLIFIIMIAEIIAKTLGYELPIPMRLWTFIQWLIATPVLFVTGWQFLKGAGRFFRTGIADMDTLVGIGTTVAYLYSTFVFGLPEIAAKLDLPPDVYFDATIIVTGFVLFGKYLETRKKIQTSGAIEKLMQLKASIAHVKRNGRLEDISVDDIKPGDICLVKAGEKIPTDGTIIEGASTINESMITGESMPVNKKTGDKVIGATINQEGVFQMRVEKIGSETVLAQIIRMVQEAQGSKAPIQRLADLIAAYFVPIVLALTVLSGVLWIVIGRQYLLTPEIIPLMIRSVVGILVIACPCAMGLATPTAIVVATGRAAEHGILIKNAETLEIADKITTIVFDKTGTLTKGTPEITDIISASEDTPQNTLLTIAASLENASEHPIGKAIVRHAQQNAIKLTELKNVRVTSGAGIQGTINNTIYSIGRESFLQKNGISTPEKLTETINRLMNEAKTVIHIASEKAYLGAIALADTPKDVAETTVQELKKSGYEIIMITGDNKATATGIASQLGIDEILAEVHPGEKAQKIKELQTQGKKVAMVGDGINDAPSLATADIGIAMSTGTDVAMESAGITLMGGDIGKIAHALTLSKKTLRIIKQNLFWAFIYNIIGIPVAAGLLYPFFGILLNPALAGIAMAMSSVSVLTNSLRLKRA